jgi:hypothetical protein
MRMRGSGNTATLKTVTTQMISRANTPPVLSPTD